MREWVYGYQNKLHLRELEYNPMLEETSGLVHTSSRNVWKHRKGYEKVICIFKRFYKRRSVSWGKV